MASAAAVGALRQKIRRASGGDSLAPEADQDIDVDLGTLDAAIKLIDPEME
jgi:hypothetical protein